MVWSRECRCASGNDTSAHPAVSGHPVHQPPVGALRWQAPQPVTPWTTTLQATKAPPCPQILPVVNIETGSENCLYLTLVPAAVPTAPPGR